MKRRPEDIGDVAGQLIGGNTKSTLSGAGVGALRGALFHAERSAALMDDLLWATALHPQVPRNRLPAART